MDTPPRPFEALADLDADLDDTEAARKLGDAIDSVAKLQTWLRQARQRRVRGMYAQMRAEGKSYTDVGKELGVTRARAQQIAEGYVGGRPRGQVHHPDADARNTDPGNLELRETPEA